MIFFYDWFVSGLSFVTIFFNSGYIRSCIAVDLILISGIYSLALGPVPGILML